MPATWFQDLGDEKRGESSEKGINDKISEPGAIMHHEVDAGSQNP